MSQRSWLESRTGIGRTLKAFFTERVPASMGWRNTLGSLAGALLLLQILTGFLLAIYYVPHPEAAYLSLNYIEEHVTLGAFMRALHYWGASFIVVAVFVHMMRVIITGAYRKPREINWIIGLALLGVTLALAFTGQLLPYNESGYWAAKVGVEIASSAPIIGSAIRKMMLGGDEVGALALTRFYAMHMILLPMLLGFLVFLHLYLLRFHNPAAQPEENESARIPFYPVPFFRDMVTISVGVIALAVTTIVFKTPAAEPLDLSDSTFVPRPEWYFLAHYELLRYTPGALKIVTTFVLPTIVMIVLVLLPWIDRGKTSRFRDRRGIVSMATLGAAIVVGLTLFGVMSISEQEHVNTLAANAVGDAGGVEVGQARLAAGRRAFQQLKCYDCHKVGRRGRDIGPVLTYVGSKMQEPFLRAWLKDPTILNPDTPMPPVQTDDETFDDLVFYLMSLKAEDL